VHPRTLFYYEARIALGLTALLPALALILYAPLHLAFREPTSTYPLMRAFEVIFPLAAGLIAAGMMTVEREENFFALQATYAEPRWHLPLRRSVGALVMAAIALGLGIIALSFAESIFPFREIVLPALGPALFLLGMGLLVGNLSGQYWFGSATVMGYWFFEFFTRGDTTKSLFLFLATWPRDGVDYGMNRWMLAALGVAFLVANLLVSLRRRP
jgi:hypothetical protein